MNDVGIQQAAALTRVSAHTLRYYERVGLVPGVLRTRAGHRRYPPTVLEWIRLLHLLRATGLPIRQLQSFLKIVAQGERSIPDRIAFFRERQSALREEIALRQQALDLIDHKIRANQTLLRKRK